MISIRRSSLDYFTSIIAQINTKINIYLYSNNKLKSQSMLAHKSVNYTNNASGNMNKQQEKNKYKQIDLDDLDVEMISPQFLQNKTLKKPFKEFQISAIKTNPNGLKESSSYRNEPPTKQYPEVVIFKKDEAKSIKKKESTMSIIDVSELNIKPAFKRSDDDTTASYNLKNNEAVVIQKDKNTILSALLRKGLKPDIVIKPDIMITKQEKTVGPAQSKLKALMGKTNDKGTKKQQVIQRQNSKRSEARKQNNSEIGEQINEQFDEYGNQSFQKLSGAYESVIKQSIIGDSNIRQSIAGESNIIKESIRESIRQSIASSSGKIKESIREDIKESIQESSRSLKEEIIQQISASHRKSKESIEQVYEEIFEEESLSNSLSKSQNKFKKSVKNNNDSDSLSQSQSASKSFRMKTNVVKSLKFAEQLSKREKQQSIKIEIIQDKAISDKISKQKQNIKRIQDNISKLLIKKPTTTNSQKNKDLYYNFKVEINKLLTGDQFDSKLKKLVSFLSVGDNIVPNKKYMEDLQDNILKNIMSQVENIKIGKSHLTEVEKIKKQYEDKLAEQLRIQQVNLRAEMNQKLSEKDFQLKKMIAELESRMMSRTIQVEGHGRMDYSSLGKSQQYQVDSDYSIDSDNISWKADLWELLPQYEKKKLYEKQTAEVTKFLADVMINQLKQEALERSLDISFQFPEEYNNLSDSFEKNQEKYFEKQKTSDKPFSKKQVEAKHDRSDFLADLPKIPMKKAVNHDENKSFSAPKQEYDIKFQSTRKDEKIKPQIIKILSDYKPIYLKKKQEAVKNVLKVLTSKDRKVQDYMCSSLQQITILSQKQFKKQHHMYIRAYEQEIIMSLVGIYTRTLNKKQNAIEEEMKKMYDRLVVVSQVATAEKCIERISLDVQKDSPYNVEAMTKDVLRQMEFAPCPIEILANENYMELKVQKQQKQVKNEIVNNIVKILTQQFAKEFPKRKK